MKTNNQSSKSRAVWYIGAIIAVLAALMTYLTSCSSALKVSQCQVSGSDTTCFTTSINSTVHEEH